MTSAWGAPGIPPRWTSSAKDGVGTSLGPASRLWFTTSHGIVNEVYYPRVDQACLRDFGLIVTDGDTFFSEEKRNTKTKTSNLVEGVPAYGIVNECIHGRYRIEKEVFADPTRDVLLQKIRLVSGHTWSVPLRLFALVAPHLNNRGADNTAWVGEYKGVPMLFAEREGHGSLAMACSLPWRNRSAGFVGFSDGWQDLSRHKQLTWSFDLAERGNVALTGEVDYEVGVEFILALGFGLNSSEAAHRALASLEDDYETLKTQYVAEWQAWQATLQSLDESCPARGRQGCVDLYRVSTTVIRCHEEKRFPGGIIASLSIPWGFSKGDDDLGGYHLTWPRDLVETAGALLAAGANDDARRVLHYLQTTQEGDGHWPQNMWLDGRPYWNGIQMDETALPILLVDLAYREKAIDDHELERLWPMVRKAAAFVVCNGPVTQQDRWEEDPGYSPFTLAAEITSLLAAADIAQRQGQLGVAKYLRETADLWYTSLDRWTYATNTELSNLLGVEGYYVRIAPPETSDASSPVSGFVPIKNRPPGENAQPAANVVSPDALALVRFGLRRGDDPRILNTIAAIDHLLKVDFPAGPCWYRYNHDGYGEHADGTAFDGTGIGRAWPLLTGERAHYELAAGNRVQAEALLAAFGAFANETGMIPEQTWDSDDVLDKELFRGKPAGSAMPLVWAHAEYVKLLRSLRDGRVFDMPLQGARRYLVDKVASNLHEWRFNHKCRTLPRDKTLRIVTPAPTRVRWTINNWQVVQNADSHDTTLGMHYVDVPTKGLPSGTCVQFTFYWLDSQRWEGSDFSVSVE
ncbi:MAG: glucan 1,4-alpha-glucosidase [Planctomycetaceae bacterium]|nr:glucan 1,4-alpha-glucosidase [Planctomycetales bacterium]MCB9924147.1 glucan 1,4-alpha-glucosidase [Planctomycetaceae bacterium]